MGDSYDEAKCNAPWAAFGVYCDAEWNQKCEDTYIKLSEVNGWNENLNNALKSKLSLAKA